MSNPPQLASCNAKLQLFHSELRVPQPIPEGTPRNPENEILISELERKLTGKLRAYLCASSSPRESTTKHI